MAAVASILSLSLSLSIYMYVCVRIVILMCTKPLSPIDEQHSVCYATHSIAGGKAAGLLTLWTVV